MLSGENMDKNLLQNLIIKAKQEQKMAYAPYSDFKVGASLLTVEGKVFCGCNIENSSFGLSICAERVAVFNAISAGFRDFKAMVIYTTSNPPATPCGACRQVLVEFNQQLKIYTVNNQGKQNSFFLGELFPDAFNREAFNDF